MALHLEESPLRGAFLVTLDRHVDDRGFFARTFSSRDFTHHGLKADVVECSLSSNTERGTLRGLHYQTPPAAEAKLVRCTRGAIFDVIVDLRPDSPSRFQHFAVELTAESGLGLYVPELFAHGFQTLADDTEVFYQISAFYAPEFSRGLRYDDPVLAIHWPLPVARISERDQHWPAIGASGTGLL